MKDTMYIGRSGRMALTSIKRIKRDGLRGSFRRKAFHHHALAVITSGEGMFMLNGKLYSANKGDAFLLAPGMLIEGQSSIDEPISFSLLLFNGVQLSRREAAWHPSELKFPVSGKLSPKACGQAASLLEDDSSRRESDDSDCVPDVLHLKYRLHRFLERLMNGELEQSSPSEPVVGMDYAIAYMNEHYAKDLKLEQLAGLAGLSVNHFIRTFKRRTSMTPLQYVEHRRMDKAKRLIIDSSKIKEIARAVGYKDEHYFSRAFKKAEGVAPTLYIKNKCNRIATIYYGLDDYLTTLGLKPVAALSYAGRVSTAFDGESLHHKDGEKIWLDGAKPEYGKLLRSKPDLILTSDRLKEDISLQAIAPIAILRHSNENGEMLRHIGHLFGKEREARQWLERYTSVKSNIREKLVQEWGHQTACFVRICGSFYRVYGASNQTGSLLHEDLSLGLPDGLQARSWIDFPLSEWASLRPDHIFLMTDPTEEAKTRLKMLQQSESWRALPAVRDGHVYEAGDLFFRALGPTGRLSAVRRIARQLKLPESDIVQRN
ncbi:AraC family transcriptional regulator [Paenibacillus sp. strain BS8-2]